MKFLSFRFSRLVLVAACLGLALGSARAQTAVPTVSAALSPVTVSPNDGVKTVDLSAHFTVPGVTGPVVRFETSFGAFSVELRDAAAPRHVANFLAYVDAERYDNTIVHRSAALDGTSTPSIVQGGGYKATVPTDDVPAFGPIALEYNLPNLRASLAAARTNDVNSATKEWFFNTKDNSTILGPSNNGGYSVFGRVMGTGMTVVDRIAAVQRYNVGAPFSELPLRNYTTGNIQVSNLVIIERVRRVPIHPTATQVGVLAYSATSSNTGVATVSVTGSTLTITPVAAGTTTVTVKATDVNNNQATTSATVTVSGPAITRQPESITLAPGGRGGVDVVASSSGTLTYQWFKNGAAISGATGSSVSFASASASDSGDYTVTVSDSSGSVTSAVATVLVATPAPGKLINLAVRSRAGSGDKTLIAGFTTTGGSGPGVLRLRALGPKLTEFNVPGVLSDPLLQVYQGATVVTSNDNVASEVAASFGLAPGNLDAALEASLPANAYTAQVTGVGGVEGVALIEVNDGAPDSMSAALPRLINVAARTEVGTGANVLIAGFTINGNVPKRLLIRALGPKLTDFGVGGVLADPQLKVFRGTTEIAANDDVSATNAAAASLTAGAKDAALVVVLTPGAYTAQVSGVGDTSGVALIEVTELQ